MVCFEGGVLPYRERVSHYWPREDVVAPREVEVEVKVKVEVRIRHCQIKEAEPLSTRMSAGLLNQDGEALSYCVTNDALDSIPVRSFNTVDERSNLCEIKTEA